MAGNYSWDAQDYSRHSSNQFQWAKELIPKLKLSGKEDLLDIGCGDGKVTAELAKHLPRGRVVGVDSSSEMINSATRSFSGLSPNLSFQLMDARSLNFNEQFDKVFSNAALHWVVDQPAVLRGVRKSLRAGGSLLFQMAGKGNAQKIRDVFGELLVQKTWEPFFEGFAFPYGFHAPEEYRDWLEEAGFRCARAELLAKDMQLPGAAGLAGWIRTTWLPYTERVPIEKRDSFIEEIVECYLELFPAEISGVVHVEMMRLEVEASKP